MLKATFDNHGVDIPVESLGRHLRGQLFDAIPVVELALLPFAESPLALVEIRENPSAGSVKPVSGLRRRMASGQARSNRLGSPFVVRRVGRV